MRWAPDARGRLERAAFELFSEQGYSAVTVPQITARAGLATRTFFRYFSDKREVVFGGNEIPEEAARLIRAAPSDLHPMGVVRLVLEHVAIERFEGRRDEVAVWRRMINADDSLRDRDARKRADLVIAAEAAFIDRGESSLSATVVAEVGALVFHVALDTWVTRAAPRSMTDTIAEVMSLLDVGGPARSMPLTEFGHDGRSPTGSTLRAPAGPALHPTPHRPVPAGASEPPDTSHE